MKTKCIEDMKVITHSAFTDAPPPWLLDGIDDDLVSGISETIGISISLFPCP